MADDDEEDKLDVDGTAPDATDDDDDDAGTADEGPPGSDDPFADDDDDDFDFPMPGDDDDDDDDFDFALSGEDDDDDDFDMPDLGDYVPAGKGGGGRFAGLKENLSGGSIALIASGGALLLILVGLVTWLSLSFDEDAMDKSDGQVEVVTSLAGLAPPPGTAAKTKSKSPTKPKAPSPKAAAKPAAKTDAAAKPGADTSKTAAADTGGIIPTKKKPASGKTDAKSADKAADKKDADAKPGEAKPGEAKPGELQVAKIDPAMIVETPDGPLPVIAPDGRQAWQVYARPFKQPAEDEKAGKVALVIAGLGLSKTQTLAAIQELPGEVTLSFAPYARNLGDWIAQARAAGHEVILEIPMEPEDYPDSDPGPHTLLTSKSPEENIKNLNWLLSRFPGYVGITNFLGDKFTAREAAMTPVLDYLKKRGLMYLDSRASRKSVGARLAKEIKMPRAYNTRFIDREASRVSIDARLFELERIAKSTGASVGIGFAYPVTLERLKNWIAEARKKKIVLAPLSAVANLQTIR